MAWLLLLGGGFRLWSHRGVLVDVSSLKGSLDLADECELALLVHFLLGELVSLVLHSLVLEALQTLLVISNLWIGSG